MSERYDKGKIYEEDDGEFNFSVLDDGTELVYNEDGITELLNDLDAENQKLKEENESLRRELCNCEEDYIYEEMHY